MFHAPLCNVPRAKLTTYDTTYTGKVRIHRRQYELDETLNSETEIEPEVEGDDSVIGHFLSLLPGEELRTTFSAFFDSGPVLAWQNDGVQHSLQPTNAERAHETMSPPDSAVSPPGEFGTAVISCQFTNSRNTND